MQAAGLTHGGFYKHFGSRDDLVAEATAHALTANDDRLDALLRDAEDPLRAFVEWYVSAEHRDAAGTGCGVVALGADVGRAGSDPRVRAAYAERVERYLARLEDLLGEDRARAPVVLATLVGAVLVARALGDTPRSDALLATVRAALTPR
jgi:TetR/AcrR family transcriptional repressor of nem operon